MQADNRLNTHITLNNGEADKRDFRTDLMIVNNRLVKIVLKICTRTGKI